MLFAQENIDTASTRIRSFALCIVSPADVLRAVFLLPSPACECGAIGLLRTRKEICLPSEQLGLHRARNHLVSRCSSSSFSWRWERCLLVALRNVTGGIVRGSLRVII